MARKDNFNDRVSRIEAAHSQASQHSRADHAKGKKRGIFRKIAIYCAVIALAIGLGFTVINVTTTDSLKIAGASNAEQGKAVQALKTKLAGLFSKNNVATPEIIDSVASTGWTRITYEDTKDSASMDRIRDIWNSQEKEISFEDNKDLSHFLDGLTPPRQSEFQTVFFAPDGNLVFLAYVRGKEGQLDKYTQSPANSDASELTQKFEKMSIANADWVNRYPEKLGVFARFDLSQQALQIVDLHHQTGQHYVTVSGFSEPAKITVLFKALSFASLTEPAQKTPELLSFNKSKNSDNRIGKAGCSALFAAAKDILCD